MSITQAFLCNSTTPLALLSAPFTVTGSCVHFILPLEQSSDVANLRGFCCGSASNPQLGKCRRDSGIDAARPEPEVSYYFETLNTHLERFLGRTPSRRTQSTFLYRSRRMTDVGSLVGMIGRKGRDGCSSEKYNYRVSVSNDSIPQLHGFERNRLICFLLCLRVASW